MRISELLKPERVAVDVPAASKKAVLEKLADLIASDVPQLTRGEVFDRLVARERLGSTGLGHGVAIPHCRVDHARRALGAVVRTCEGVDFDAIDDEPVDLFFALSVPSESAEEHLALLAELAGMFSDERFREAVRGGANPGAVYELLDHWQGPE